MKKMRKIYPVISAVILILGLTLGLAMQKNVPSNDFAVKVQAAEQMARCMQEIAFYKEESGIGLSSEDALQTGLIGEPYTPITTTSGALEAKRTCANPNMAALAVQLLTEAGVKKNDRVAAAFSGSFPGMNLAVICACEAMQVELIYISSVGASTYGANQPEFTFPDMTNLLWEKGLISHKERAVSFGGQDDCGLDLEPAIREEIKQRLTENGSDFIYQPDYLSNLEVREALYEADGEVTCFIGVGGNLTTAGPGENTYSQRYGVIAPDETLQTDEKSGLLQRYSARGKSVIHLLNIKKLVAEYGMPYDPEGISAPGAGSPYEQKKPAMLPIAIGMFLSVCVLVVGRIESGKGRTFFTTLTLCFLLLLSGCGEVREEAKSSFTVRDFPEYFETGAPTEAFEEKICQTGGDEVTVCTLQAEVDGPSVYIVAGLHGDETAGYTAADLMKEWELAAGTVYIVSPANTYGAEKIRRTTRSDRDINRQFPGKADGNDAEQIAAAIFADIESKQPDLVLDLHEAHAWKDGADELADSVIVQSTYQIGDLVWAILTESEEGKTLYPPLSFYGAPPKGSLNREVTTIAGIPVITFETDLEKELTERVQNQLAFVSYILEYYGIR